MMRGRLSWLLALPLLGCSFEGFTAADTDLGSSGDLESDTSGDTSEAGATTADSDSNSCLLYTSDAADEL
ncbi:MAG: hypothetical protein KUG77_03145 [Nannocystaceae bacterium]|nr:hypothetical protein [Nannocystaceae bacterium]